MDANGSPVTEPFEKIPCLQQQRFRAAWAISNQPAIWVGSYTRGGVPFGSPCDQDSFSMIDSGLPEYVTATPVPAWKIPAKGERPPARTLVEVRAMAPVAANPPSADQISNIGCRDI